MRTDQILFNLIIILLFAAVTAHSQTINFDETWKEFLENNKISNMSALARPDKNYDPEDYAKYLLMNTNSSFCQSEQEEAESLMAEVRAMDSDVLEAIPGFVKKMEELDAKIKAYHSIDAIWMRFLQSGEVSLEELDAVTAAKTSCEKKTLAKYSYLTAYHHMCRGDVKKARDIFENRTLRLTEKTTLQVEDVEGLAAQVAKMKSLFRDMAQLDIAWKTFMDTGRSPGFDLELPLFPCYPIPNMKALLLRGATDVCALGPPTLEKIRKLQAGSGVAPDGELQQKMKELEAAVQQNEAALAALNEAWEAFLPDNKVKRLGSYGYDYCSKEALIRAYIMDGFTFVCGKAEEVLDKIDDLQRPEPTPLEETTIAKINELHNLSEQYQANGQQIEKLWSKFIAQGDTLREDFQSTVDYCDNIQQIKDWTMKGLCGSCEDGPQYLDLIEDFQETFEFNFTEELECRVQNLRFKVWNCRYQALVKLARVEAPDAYEERLKELMEEYGVGERPEVCSMNN